MPEVKKPKPSEKLENKPKNEYNDTDIKVGPKTTTNIDGSPKGKAMAKSKYIKSNGVSYSSKEAQALMEKAADKVGVKLDKVVDVVKVRPGDGEFILEDGRRVLYLSEDLVQKGGDSALRQALHELGHAEDFQKVVTKGGYGKKVGKAWKAYMKKDYARDEVIADRLARMRMKKYFGGISEEIEESIKGYIKYWKNNIK
jgi:hypothetical protein